MYIRCLCHLMFSSLVHSGPSINDPWTAHQNWECLGLQLLRLHHASALGTTRVTHFSELPDLVLGMRILARYIYHQEIIRSPWEFSQPEKFRTWMIFWGRGLAGTGFSRAHTSKAQNFIQVRTQQGKFCWENSKPGRKGLGPRERPRQAADLPLKYATGHLQRP